MEAIRVKNLGFSYSGAEKSILEDCSFSIKEGEFVVICGESGCGKTTLLRLLKKELTRAGKMTGELSFYRNGEVAELLPSEIGYVMQNPDAQIVTDEVWHELAFGLENMGVSSERIRCRVAEMAQYFGIEHWFHKNTWELSGGQKQILNLAAVLVMEPRVLLLDEPTAQLDPIMAEEFIQTVKKLNEQLGLTVIMVEHHLEGVLAVADRLLVLNEGTVVEDDHPRKIMEKNLSWLQNSVPTAVKLYHGIAEKKSVKNRVAPLNCPLTEKEARAYLRELHTVGITPIGNIIEVPIQEEQTKSTKAEVAVEVKELYFRYERAGKDILKGVSLKLESGKIYSLLGGNGSGKTTLLSVLSGQKKAYSGACYFYGKKISAYKGNSLYVNGLGYLPQNPSTLFVRNTVEEDLLEMEKVLVCGKEEIQIRIHELAQRLGILDVLHQHPYDLSGGQQQRAGLAKVLLLKPKVLILDEPTKGLDGTAKKELKELLLLLKKEGITILTVTHDVEFAAESSDQCGIFFDHQVIAMDTPRAIFAENRFFTTQASRIIRPWRKEPITCQEVIACY